jgi:hypothetical protein
MTTTTTTNLKSFPVLSIDAWGNQEDGYDWNSWHKVGMIDLDLNLDADRDIIRAMVSAGYLTATGLDVCDIDDDGFNIVIVDKETREPVFAIEYGSII